MAIMVEQVEMEQMVRLKELTGLMLLAKLEAVVEEAAGLQILEPAVEKLGMESLVI